MPIPTMKEVVSELKKLGGNSDPQIARSAIRVLEQLSRLSLDNPSNAMSLGSEIKAIIVKNNPAQNKNDKILSNVLYHTLLVIGCIYARNAKENGQYIDPITLSIIKKKHLFLSTDLYQWDVHELIHWIEISGHNYINPVTKEKFNSQDIQSMRKIANKTISPYIANNNSVFSSCFPFFRKSTSVEIRNIHILRDEETALALIHAPMMYL